MIIISDGVVTGKCLFCEKLLTDNDKHYSINRDTHIYRICSDCYKEFRIAGGGKAKDE